MFLPVFRETIESDMNASAYIHELYLIIMCWNFCGTADAILDSARHCTLFMFYLFPGFVFLSLTHFSNGFP